MFSIKYKGMFYIAVYPGTRAAENASQMNAFPPPSTSQ